MHGDQFNCRQCRLGHHCDEGRQWAVWDDKNHRVVQSVGPADFDMLEIPGTIVSRTCFLPLITDESRMLLRLHGHYKQHHLPDAGGVMDQPSVIMEAIEVIEHTVQSIESDRAKRAKRG